MSNAAFVYESVTTNWSSSSSPKNDKIYGTRNIVTIKNGKGKKVKESLNKEGNVIERNAKTLKKKEIEQIKSGTFVPGLWKNCQIGKVGCGSARNRTRRNITRKIK
ncbi:MAG: hypothetical protein EBQ66_02955 [Flavobacteriia bacterium]|jgi:hypothetical protein|nr:hypothetical protein [Flavobacteriia bacterium]